MRHRLILLLSLCCFPIFTFGSTIHEDNSDLIAKTQNLLSELKLNRSSMSLNKDSSRFDCQGGYFDIFFKDKRLWDLKFYDKKGNRTDSSNFKNGNGFIYFKNNSAGHYAEVENGFLDGKAEFYLKYSRNEYKVKQTNFYKNGVKHGVCTTRSLYNTNAVVQKQFYEDGEIKKAQEFGIKKIRFAFTLALFKPVITQPEKLCSESIYEDGVIVSTTCYVKKCRSCAN